MTAQPHISVNYITLTEAESLAIRAAIWHFLDDLRDEDFCDLFGTALAAAYRAHLGEVQRILMSRVIL